MFTRRVTLLSYLSYYLRTMKLILTTILLFSITSSAQEFFKPDSEYLTRQKDFWKNIYTHYTSSETIIHDKSEPSIIYKVIDHEGYTHHGRKSYVRKQVKKLRNTLKSIKRKRGKRLTKNEQEIYSKIPKKYRKNLSKRIKRLRYQQGMRDRFLAGLERSNKYLHIIKKIFSEYDLPEELAYLPHVESSFNYKAYSSVGAAGIWQFMRSSAKLFKLEINNHIDERLDITKATVAAAKHFKENYLILKQSWPIAITAYNHGPSGLRRAMRKLRTKDFTKIITQYETRNFSFASKNFYGSFLAAVEVSENYWEYFPEVEFMQEKHLITEKLDSSKKVEDLLTEHQLTLEKFKEYNPAVKKRVYANNLKLPKNTEIYLPAAVYEIPEVQEKTKNMWEKLKDYVLSFLNTSDSKVATKQQKIDLPKEQS